jgi:hypothetical protein
MGRAGREIILALAADQLILEDGTEIGGEMDREEDHRDAIGQAICPQSIRMIH